MKTLLEVLNSGTSYLAAQGCDEARSIMQHLMAHILHCNRTYLYSHFDRPMTEEELAPLRDLLRRKAAGEPLQHLLGTTEFFKREFLTDARALIPRPETEELVEFILSRIPRREKLRLLDMGTGSGIIGITLARELEQLSPTVVLADISDAALSLALENSMRLGAKVSTIASDLFAAFDEPKAKAEKTEDEEKTEEGEPIECGKETFDLIAANLPYIAEGEPVEREVGFDPSSALYGGAKGWEIVERFLTDAPRFLSPDGEVALEIGYDQGSIVADIMERLGYRDIEVLKDLNGIARFPFGKRPSTP